MLEGQIRLALATIVLGADLHAHTNLANGRYAIWQRVLPGKHFALGPTSMLLSLLQMGSLI